MTTLEKLALLVDMIPAEKQAAFQASLGEMLQDYTEPDAVALSSESEAELDERLSNPSPSYATDEEMASIWGKPLPS